MGLNNFNPAEEDVLGRYVYDRRTLNFRDLRTGRLVSRDNVNAMVDFRIKEGINRLNEMADGVMTGSTPYGIADLQRATAIEIRNMQVQLAAMGKGGRANMTPADWGKVGATLREEFKYLNGFMAELSAGNLTEGQVRNRLRMYGNKAYNQYWNTRQNGAAASGFTEERRVLDRSAETCRDCEDLAALGWQPLGSLPNPADGSTVCLSNCRCSKEYR
jgi:hypothetical protein